MSVAENIRRRREELGINQSRLAEAVGIKQSSMAQIERGSRVPNVMLGKDIARVLQCTLDDLVGEERRE